MHSHFNLKSLAFYGTAISSVLLLFKGVTAYGETRLQAPTKISDRYSLTLNQPLLNCQKPESLILEIQQSGMYVNASLLPANISSKKSRAAEKKPSLTGLLTNQKLTISGTVPSTTLCPVSKLQSQAVQSNQNHQLKLVTVQMSLKSGDKSLGEITISGNTKAMGFSAIAAKNIESTEDSNKH